MQKEQHVIGDQAPPGEHFDGEEIDSSHHCHMRTNELGPCCALATLRRRRNPESSQNVAHGLIGDLMTKLLNAPAMRSYPQRGFSRAMRTSNSPTSRPTGGRP